MTALRHGSVIRREISIPDLLKPVQVEITSTTISFHVKGQRKKCFATWKQVVKACSTPNDVPSFLMDKPLEMLIHQAAKK